VTIVFMFPGQSSRYPELLKKLIVGAPQSRSVVRDASDVLGRDLEKHFTPENGAIFDCNQDIQIAVFLANYIHGLLLRARGVEPDLSLGLSLGEYNHLVDIGALSFEAALRLVAARGALYDRGPEGVMAAVGPVAIDDLEDVIAKAQLRGAVEIAVENSPTHHVIAGNKAAVEAAVEALEEHFVSASLIEERIAMHTSSFAVVAEQFRPWLEEAPWHAVRGPYFPNDTAEPIADPSFAVFVSHLVSQVFRPVKWRTSIEVIANLHPDAVFIEVGPRAVLYNLLQSRWIPNRKFKSDGAALDELDIDVVCAALKR
jgi:[acyl-carrier-protein] S-malonyltransferase